jgi:transcriptional regulator with XRE-family HTH domain
MHRVPDSQVVTLLLGRSRHALGVTQNGLAQVLGVARRTIGRWEGRRSVPSLAQLGHLARAVYPRDATLAGEIAAESGTSLEALGLVPPAPPAPAPPAAPTSTPLPAAAPSRPYPPVDLLVESVIHVASRALEGEHPDRDSIGATTAILRVAFARAALLGLSLSEVVAVLSPGQVDDLAPAAVVTTSPKRSR